MQQYPGYQNPYAGAPYPQAPAPMGGQDMYRRQQPAGEFYWVRGFAEADAWPIREGEKVVLLDELEDAMYIRTCDRRGKPVTLAYDTHERQTPQPVDMRQLEAMVVGIMDRHMQERQQAAREAAEHGEQDV